MTLREWLLARDPRPPAALEARLLEVLGDELSRDAADAPGVLVAASERVVQSLLATNATSRDSALDLLVADSLVTYAFEAAAEQATSIPAHAHAAMRRIAALALGRA